MAEPIKIASMRRKGDHSGAKAEVAKSRQDKTAITGFFKPEVRKEMAKLAIDLEITQQQAIAEALNLFFEKHGKPPIAEG